MFCTPKLEPSNDMLSKSTGIGKSLLRRFPMEVLFQPTWVVPVDVLHDCLLKAAVVPVSVFLSVEHLGLEPQRSSPLPSCRGSSPSATSSGSYRIPSGCPRTPSSGTASPGRCGTGLPSPSLLPQRRYLFTQFSREALNDVLDRKASGAGTYCPPMYLRTSFSFSFFDSIAMCILLEIRPSCECQHSQ